MATPDTSLTLYGFWHLEAETVRVSILGVDMGTAVVSDEGSITIDYASDAGGLVTPAYLRANSNALTGVENNVTISITDAVGTTSVTVPIVVGFDYTTQGQLLRPDVTSDIRSNFGPGLGKTRRTFYMAALMQNVVEVKFGTDFTNTEYPLTTAVFTSDGYTALAEDVPFSGVYESALEGTYDLNGQLCWQVDGPYPCTIAAVAAWVDHSER
jgi:hypothetical protein